MKIIFFTENWVPGIAKRYLRIIKNCQNRFRFNGSQKKIFIYLPSPDALSVRLTELLLPMVVTLLINFPFLVNQIKSDENL